MTPLAHQADCFREVACFLLWPSLQLNVIASSWIKAAVVLDCATHALDTYLLTWHGSKPKHPKKEPNMAHGGSQSKYTSEYVFTPGWQARQIIRNLPPEVAANPVLTPTGKMRLCITTYAMAKRLMRSMAEPAAC